MSTSIQFTNSLGSNITAQQQSTLVNYNRLTYNNGLIKMIESFEQFNQINYKTVKYFMDSTEDKNTIIQQNSDPLNNVQCIVYFNQSSANGFNLWDWESYSMEGQIGFKGHKGFDVNNKAIFICTVDISTNVLLNGASKFYYANQLQNEFDDCLLEFRYTAAGDVDLIYDVHGNFGYDEAITLDAYLNDTVFSQQDFSFEQHPYYQSVYPFLPDGNL